MDTLTNQTRFIKFKTTDDKTVVINTQYIVSITQHNIHSVVALSNGENIKVNYYIAPVIDGLKDAGYTVTKI